MLRLFFLIGMFEDTELGMLARRLMALDEPEIFVEASDKEVLEHIELLNKRQLIKGRNSEGELLSNIGGEYSDTTMELAELEGRPKDSKSIVNLFSDGDFHKSIKADVEKEGYEITSDPIKRDPLNGLTTNLLERYGEEVEGLEESSIKDLVETKLLDKYVKAAEKKIFEGQ